MKNAEGIQKKKLCLIWKHTLVVCGHVLGPQTHAD